MQTPLLSLRKLFENTSANVESHILGNLHCATKLFTVSTMAAQSRIKIYSFSELHLLIKCLVTKLQTKRSSGLLVCKFYSEIDRNNFMSHSVCHTIRELNLSVRV